ncbi:MAG: DivIVA domain-containing protein [Mycoplasmataceae bacterium]|jgi:DivIVA domain-containing protein|nr:DivIVA domain-containing protein [Mycoplasmataceae bacterium]
MPNKLEVMMEEILQKKFSKRIHSGYDPEDVDNFFDYVISYLNDINIDSNRLYAELKNSQLENHRLKEQLQQKTSTIDALNGQIEYFHKEGYSNLRQSQEMLHVRNKLSEIEKNLKK